MKQLLIARHAKSSREGFFLPDFDRGLNKRGKVDIQYMAHLLAEEVKKPDLIISSPAKRAKKTATAYAKKRGYTKKHIIREKLLYEASVDIVLDLIKKTDSAINRLMIIGHNPAMTQQIQACGYALDNLPTCGVVVLQYPGDEWHDFDPTKCVFEKQFFPKEIKNKKTGRATSD